jgi:hypothetical protein
VIQSATATLPREPGWLGPPYAASPVSSGTSVSDPKGCRSDAGTTTGGDEVDVVAVVGAEVGPAVVPRVAVVGGAPVVAAGSLSEVQAVISKNSAKRRVDQRFTATSGIVASTLRHIVGHD